MKDRFDLEEETMRLYSFAEDVDTVSNFLMESDGIDDDVRDNCVNALNGISALMKMHSQNMLDTLCQCFKLNQYNQQKTSELSVEIPLTDADNRVTTSCKGECGRVHQSYGFPMD